MRQRGFTFIEEVDAAIVGFSGIVEVFVFHIDEFLAMDIFVRSVCFPRPRFTSRDVDFEALVSLTDVGQILRLEIEIARVEAPVLVGGIKNRLRIMLKREVIGINVGGLQSFGGIVPTSVLADSQITVLLCVTRQIVIHRHSHIELLMRVGEGQIIRITRHCGTHLGFLVYHHESSREIEVVHVVTINDEQVVA